ncbi:MAG: universal stress protein family protein [Glaciihabitans sp.]|jgi:nucleotide-binding universal stress UspA family protein|nr:universal stress protein family protein [Glaciihabitans sp.]MDQ1556513.1 hypothetical protein [Actinomycetota bacterium]
MNKMSSNVAGDPALFVADTHGARYESASQKQDRLAPPPKRRGTIVVGVDGSESSVTALRRGVKMADALNASVRAISSWRIPTGYSTYASFEYSPEDDAKSILSGAVKSVFGTKVPDWFSTATYPGPASQVLIEQSRDAEMLVVGSRGHGGLAGVLLGSVSASCAERAHCPVLIIH